MSRLLEAARQAYPESKVLPAYEALQRLDGGASPEIAIAQRILGMSETIRDVLRGMGGEEEIALPRLIDIFALRVGKPLRFLDRQEKVTRSDKLEIYAYEGYFTATRRVTFVAPESGKIGVPQAIIAITKLMPNPLAGEEMDNNTLGIFAEWSKPAVVENETGLPKDVIYTAFHIQEKQIDRSGIVENIDILQCSIYPHANKVYLTFPLDAGYSYVGAQHTRAFDFNGYQRG